MGFFHAMASHPHGEFEESNVAGLFIVGDASGDVQFAIVAAAEGARAAVAINKAILRGARLIWLALIIPAADTCASTCISPGSMILVPVHTNTETTGVALQP